MSQTGTFKMTEIQPIKLLSCSSRYLRRSCRIWHLLEILFSVFQYLLGKMLSDRVMPWHKNRMRRLGMTKFLVRASA